MTSKQIFYMRAMAYNVIKEIGSLYFAAGANVDAVILTGGLARNEFFVQLIKDKIQPIKPVVVYPGEDEMRALAEGALRVLAQEEKLQVYE